MHFLDDSFNLNAARRDASLDSFHGPQPPETQHIMFNQKCPLCPAASLTYTSHKKLVNHLAIRHRDSEGNVIFRCCHCKETFRVYSSLRTHIRRKHGDASSQQDANDTISSSDSMNEDRSSDEDEEETEGLDSVFIKAGPHLRFQDELQFKAAALLIKLKEINNATQRVVDNVIAGVDAIYDSLLDLLQEQFALRSNEDVLSVDEVIDTLERMREQSVFEGVNSVAKLEKFMDREQGLVLPEKIVVLKKEVIKNNVKEVVDIDYGYMVPFLPSLHKIVSCPEVLECIDNPLPSKPGVFSSPLDGYAYSNHPTVKKYPNSLAFGIYTDSVVLSDTASSKASDSAVTFMYFILFNIYPKLNSTTRAIFLLGSVKTSVLKKHGYSEFLKDFINSVNKLSSTEGVTFRIDGKDRVFHGVFLYCCGDNPASENLGGFKESHFASKPCRQCLVSKQDMFKYFSERNFPVRSMTLHLSQVKELEEYFEAPQGKDNPSVAYGINRRSPLMDIDQCDVTKCLPQDFMHDTIEGTLKLEICCLLDHVIAKNYMSLRTINERIQLFSKCFGVNRPAIIEATHLEKKRLKQTAAETLNLAFMLPLVLRKKKDGVMVSVCEEANLNCFLMRLQLIGILMSEELTHEDVKLIRQLTEKHHLLFMSLYNCSIPKMHYEVHYAVQILLYGPPRHHWCFRFEGKHAFFKRLMRILRSRKNPSFTFAVCHQRKLCGEMLLSAKGDAGPYLQSTDCLGAAILRGLQSLVHSFGLLDVFTSIPNDAVLSLYKVVNMNGVKYGKKDVLMVAVNKGMGMPSFGEIVNILQCDGELLFLYKAMETDRYVRDAHAFKVQYCQNVSLGAIMARDLPYRHKLFFVRSVGNFYVVVRERTFGPW